jgi:hypothetical protein
LIRIAVFFVSPLPFIGDLVEGSFAMEHHGIPGRLLTVKTRTRSICPQIDVVPALDSLFLE